jgi:hypothetical protein
MPLIAGPDIQTLIGSLRKRRALLWHACQLVDFLGYLQLGGVASRAHLQGTGTPFTQFQTDGRDAENEVWDKVFFNFSDFGSCFANAHNCTPNAYGPIMLAFNPSVITGAADTSITLRSAGAEGFSRVDEGIPAAAVDQLYHKDTCCIAYSKELTKIFGVEAYSPEMNCHFAAGVAPLAHLAYVVVDPYMAGEIALADIIRNALGAELGHRVKVRNCRDGRTAEHYRELWIVIRAGARNIAETRARLGPASGLLPWADVVTGTATTAFQFSRYANYLAAGTITAADPVAAA